MGLFGRGKDKEKEQAAAKEHDEARRRMEEAVRRRREEAKPAPPAATAAPAATTPAAAPAAAPAPAAAAATEYTVRSGDSLSKIARQHLGDANKWRQIYDANRSVIGDNPDLIKPGQRLRIPS